MRGLKPEGIAHLLPIRGSPVVQVAVGEFQVQFVLDPNGPISVEGRCELINPSGTRCGRRSQNASCSCGETSMTRASYRVSSALRLVWRFIGSQFVDFTLVYEFKDDETRKGYFISFVSWRIERAGEAT